MHLLNKHDLNLTDLPKQAKSALNVFYLNKYILFIQYFLYRATLIHVHLEVDSYLCSLCINVKVLTILKLWTLLSSLALKVPCETLNANRVCWQENSTGCLLMWNWFESTLNCKFLCLSSPDQDDWNGTQRTAPGKAPPTSRGAKTSYREHPYRQYWSGLVTLSVSPWLVPVYHGSSRFKQPDKSNCLFCLWFVFLCFCFSYTGLYMNEQIGNWKSDLFLFLCFLSFDRQGPPLPLLCLTD